MSGPKSRSIRSAWGSTVIRKVYEVAYLDDVRYILNRGVEAVLMILEMVDLVGLGKLEHTLSAFTDSLETEDILDLCVYGHGEVE